MINQSQQEQLKEMHEEESQIKMSRAERRKRIRFFAPIFKEHVAKKPTVDIHEQDEEKQQQKIFEMQAWATRYGILLRKLETLGYDFEKDGQGLHGTFAKQAKQEAKLGKDLGKSTAEIVQGLSNVTK